MGPALAAQLPPCPPPRRSRPPLRPRFSDPLPQHRPRQLDHPRLPDLPPTPPRPAAPPDADRHHSRRRPRTYPARAPLAHAVEHAQSWAQTHGHLAVPHDSTQDGFPLGRWLNKQRYRARKTGPTPAAHALTAIDPWWNPPWGMTWQHAYQRARTQPHTPANRRWIHKQRRTWPLLHPDQQRLLTTTGLVVS
ncbi:helicase associated domain-containing protein [Streptomyces ossamyceticus]|uniref:helicase associated domain-containing protein n=1 Tax=Streptomyces ossamyceticus TaxID=249581 RepID=UPI003EBB1D70